MTGSWTTTPPSSLSATQAIKLTLAGPFAAGDTIVFGVGMRSPPGTPVDQFAFNSFAYQVTRNDNSSQLPVAEPNKVGIDVKRFPSIGDYVWQDLNNNGQQDEPPSAGVNGVTVKLWSPGGDGVVGGPDDFVVGTRLTADDGSGNPGYYLFDSLFTESYYLRFTPLPGRGFTYQNAGGVSDALNSDADGQTGATILTVLSPNEKDVMKKMYRGMPGCVLCPIAVPTNSYAHPSQASSCPRRRAIIRGIVWGRIRPVPPSTPKRGR